jgi:hypothetical protein
MIEDALNLVTEPNSVFKKLKICFCLKKRRISSVACFNGLVSLYSSAQLEVREFSQFKRRKVITHFHLIVKSNKIFFYIEYIFFVLKKYICNFFLFLFLMC